MSGGTAPDNLKALAQVSDSSAREALTHITSKLTALRADFAVMFHKVLLGELAEYNGTDGVQLICEGLALNRAVLNRVLSGEWDYSHETWTTIEKIFVTFATEQHGTATTLWHNMREAARVKDLLLRRRMELDTSNRREGAPKRRPSAETPPLMPTSLAADMVRGWTICPECGAASLAVDTWKATCQNCGHVSLKKTSANRAVPVGYDITRAGLRTVRELGRPPGTVPAPVRDLPGHAQSPDPLQATTGKDFMEALRALHVWSGRPSLREMERRSGDTVSYSTFRNILRSDQIPRNADNVQTFVKVLGGSDADLQRWTSAWRKIALAQSNTGTPAGAPRNPVVSLATAR